jgi:hypothetical protein
MVGIETEKVLATSSLGMPASTAESTLNLRSFEYGFMSGGYHIMDQSLRVPLMVPGLVVGTVPVRRSRSQVLRTETRSV